MIAGRQRRIADGGGLTTGFPRIAHGRLPRSVRSGSRRSGRQCLRPGLSELLEANRGVSVPVGYRAALHLACDPQSDGSAFPACVGRHRMPLPAHRSLPCEQDRPTAGQPPSSHRKEVSALLASLRHRAGYHASEAAARRIGRQADKSDANWIGPAILMSDTSQQLALGSLSVEGLPQAGAEAGEVILAGWS
jgi:hypothetical protein